jgi:hypothetical protein
MASFQNSLQSYKQQAPVQQSQPEQQPKQGFLRTLGQEIAEPFAKVAATGEKTLSQLLLGKNTSTDADFTKNVLGRQVGPAKTGMEFAGAVLEAGSNFIPVGAGAKAIGTVAKTGLKTIGVKSLLRSAGQSAGVTGLSGGLSGLGDAMQDETITPNEALKRTVIGAGVGAGLGVVAPFAGRGLQKAIAGRGSKGVQTAVSTAAQDAGQPTLTQVARQAEQAIQAPKISKKLQDVGFQKDVQNLIGKADDTVKKDMVDLFKRASQKDVSRLQAQPIYKLGQDLLRDVKILESQQKKATQIIKREVAKADNVLVDTTRAKNRFERELTKLGASVENGKINFGPRIENAADQAILQDSYDFISNPQNVKDVYRKTQSLFEKLDLGKKNNELSVAESLTKGLRSDMNQIVEDIIPIKDARRTFAELKGKLGPINKVFGSRFTPEDLKTLKADTVIGRLLNRDVGRPTEILRDIVRESAKLQGKNPDKAWSDFRRKVEFTDIIEDVFGIANSRAFKTQVGKGASEALTDVALDFVPYGGTIKTVAKGLLGKEKSLKDEQIKALKGLLGIK